MIVCGNFEQVRRTVEKRLHTTARATGPHERRFDARFRQQFGDGVLQIMSFRSSSRPFLHEGREPTRRLCHRFEHLRRDRGRLWRRGLTMHATVAVASNLLVHRHLDRPRRATGGRPARAVAFPPTRGRIERHDPSQLPRLRWRCDPLLRRSAAERSCSRQLLPQPREMLPRRATALVELQEGYALAALQNSPREAGEHARGANFHERAHPRLVELLDDRHPADRLGHLANQAVVDVRRPGQQFRRRTAISRDPRRCDRKAADRGREFVCRGREQRCMEGARHGEPLGFDPP